MTPPTTTSATIAAVTTAPRLRSRDLQERRGGTSLVGGSVLLISLLPSGRIQLPHRRFRPFLKAA
ncbi:hypothetical protein BJF90_03105 [Pseudonocardia sp. CNS-004]|nr:hypothetical protein BJF90_03105 [Pseudonocardia sp. CNS-004]